MLSVKRNGKKWGRQADKHTGRQTYRQTDRQTDKKREIFAGGIFVRGDQLVVVVVELPFSFVWKEEKNWNDFQNILPAS